MRKKILIFTVAVTAVPALALAAGVGLIVSLDYFRYSNLPSLAFDSIRWKDDLKYRHAVTGTVASRVIRPGLQRAEVEELLGQPDELGDNGSWNYRTKKPGYHPVQPGDGGVQIAFDRLGRVSSIIDDRWVD